MPCSFFPFYSLGFLSRIQSSFNDDGVLLPFTELLALSLLIPNKSSVYVPPCSTIVNVDVVSLLNGRKVTLEAGSWGPKLYFIRQHDLFLLDMTILLILNMTGNYNTSLHRVRRHHRISTADTPLKALLLFKSKLKGIRNRWSPPLFCLPYGGENVLNITKAQKCCGRANGRDACYRSSRHCWCNVAVQVSLQNPGELQVFNCVCCVVRFYAQYKHFFFKIKINFFKMPKNKYEGKSLNDLRSHVSERPDKLSLHDGKPCFEGFYESLEIPERKNKNISESPPGEEDLKFSPLGENDEWVHIKSSQQIA
ncbi:hypothetical protein GQR58_019980 [Nymphon striatum]|nr:hypothetical protein GQR58_019980 [Nymphon striatum]